MDPAHTHIACLTPPGRAAIATLAVSGPRAWEVTRALFHPAGPRRARQTAPATSADLPEEPTPGHFWFGRLGEELRDEVVLAVKRGGAEPLLEVQCHGGPEVVRLLTEAYARHGVVPCRWEDLPGLDPAAAILSRLVQAPTARTAAVLLDQYHGAFVRAVATIVEAIRANAPDRARAGLDALARHVPLGLHLVEPWRVVLAGAPNVGKSSLVNALAGYTRSLVAPTPGTTRDVVTTTVAIDGWPIELIDTAGLRDVPDGLEGAGIARARAALGQADLRLWVLDAAAAPVFPPAGEGDWLYVINKTDLPAAWDLDRVPAALRVSALTKAGLDALCAALSRTLVPAPPGAGQGVPCTPEACDLVRRAAALADAGDFVGVREILV